MKLISKNIIFRERDNKKNGYEYYINYENPVINKLLSSSQLITMVLNITNIEITNYSKIFNLETTLLGNKSPYFNTSCKYNNNLTDTEQIKLKMQEIKNYTYAMIVKNLNIDPTN